jgi:phosphoketolase
MACSTLDQVRQISVMNLCYGKAALNAYWRACNYLAAGMIYLRDNPLLREPLQPEHIKAACSATGAPARA